METKKTSRIVRIQTLWLCWLSKFWFPRICGFSSSTSSLPLLSYGLPKPLILHHHLPKQQFKAIQTQISIVFEIRNFEKALICDPKTSSSVPLALSSQTVWRRSQVGGLDVNYVEEDKPNGRFAIVSKLHTSKNMEEPFKDKHIVKNQHYWGRKLCREKNISGWNILKSTPDNDDHIDDI